MKVVLFSRYPRSYDKPHGGVESVTVILARSLAKRPDLEVHLLAFERDLATEQMERDGEVTIHRLPGSGWPQIIDILGGPGRKALIKKIYEIGPDIVHSHETYGLTLHNLRIPHVFTVHGFDHANIPAEGRRDIGRIRVLLWKLVMRSGLCVREQLISMVFKKMFW